MTCDEFRKLTTSTIGKGGPFACTRAERNAVAEHFNRCPSCEAFVARMREEERKRLGTTPAQQAVITAEMIRLVLSDLSDPEAQ